MTVHVRCLSHNSARHTIAKLPADHAHLRVSSMVEAAAVVGLVASIASLVDLGAKVGAHLHEFASQTSEVPDSFRALSTRLSDQCEYRMNAARREVDNGALVSSSLP